MILPINIEKYNKRKIFLLIGLFFLFSLIFCSLTGKVSAVETGRIGAYPTTYDPSNPLTKSWFIYSLSAGDKKEDKITVVNNAEESITVKVYPVDATTTKDGAFVLYNENDQRTDVGNWVNVSSSDITLAPKERKDIPFTITIPSNATVGDHAGGIILQESVPKKVTQQGIGMNIVSRIGVRIYETVPGTQQLNLDIRDLHYAVVNNHLTFTFTMENKGNVFLTPKGTVDVKDFFGKSVDKITIDNLGTVVPGKPTTITVTSHIEQPILGWDTANIAVTYSPLKTATASLKFLTYTWIAFIPVLIIVLIILFFILKRLFLHKKKNEYEEKLGDVEATSQKASAATAAPSSSKFKNEEVRTEQHEVIAAENVDKIFLAHHIKLIVTLILIGIIILSALFALLFHYLFIARMAVAVPVSNQPTPDFQQTVIAPTNQPIDKSSIKIVVLNGTDKVGLANTVGQKLTKDGFTVTKTNNAEKKSTQTVIQYPKGQNSGVNLLIEELKPDYTNIQQEEATDSSQFTLILGQ